MSNAQNLTAMNRKQRTQTVLNDHGLTDEQKALALLGLKSVQGKKEARGRSAATAHVVERSVRTVVQGEIVEIRRYLSNEFVRGSMVRKWTDAFGAHRFPNAKRAQDANQWQPEDMRGNVIPESAMAIPGNQLSTAAFSIGMQL